MVSFSLMTRFRHTIVIWLVTRCIIEMPRETKTHARPCVCRSLVSRPRTRVRIETLRVEAGLLRMTTLGLEDSVSVTVTCRCRLLENRRVNWLRHLGWTFIRVVIAVVTLCTRLWPWPFWVHSGLATTS